METIMRCVLPFLFVIFAVAIDGVVFLKSACAQQAIEVSSQPFGYDCLLNNDPGPGLRTVFVRLSFNPGSTGARFKLVLGPGATMTYVSESISYSYVGNTQTGISICFGSCLQGGQVQVIATVTYMSYGTDERCSELRLAPHPDAETVEVMDCNATPVTAWCADLQLLTYPPVAFPCPCTDYHKFPGNPHQFDCKPVSVENSTWGRVKALYKN
jgi:hypothetical protein